MYNSTCNSPVHLTFVTLELLHGLLLLNVPECTPGVGAGGEQLLVRAKEGAVCDKLCVLCDGLLRHGDLAHLALSAHSIVHFVDGALVVQTTVGTCMCV